MNYLKEGDVVICISVAKMKDETTNWAAEEPNLFINKDYVINDVSESGWVSLDGLKYWHSSLRFKLKEI